VTEQRRDSDGSPSVAALAVRLDGLRRDVDSLAAKVGALTSTQREQGIALDGISELRSQVEQILAILSEEGGASPTGWFWLTMNDKDHDDKLGELFDWVETVLRPQYPDYLGEQIRPCWLNHPEARWELAWLYQLWSLAYLSKRSIPKEAADWHDRWAPGVVRRLNEVMRRCQEGCQRQPGSRGNGVS
jgi:hypothetical protein